MEEKFRAEQQVEGKFNGKRKLSSSNTLFLFIDVEVFVTKFKYDGQTEDGDLSFTSEDGRERSFTKSELAHFDPNLFDYLDYFEGIYQSFNFLSFA